MAHKMRDVKQGRPFPKDWERKQRVMNLLWKNKLTITGLSELLQVSQGTLSDVIWGVRHSPVMETRIATYFGMTRAQLFPKKKISLGGIAA